jgi:hypothetical protein
MVLFSKKQSDLPGRRRAAGSRPERATEASLDDRYTFKRNRTLTGSMSSRVVSTSEGTANLKSPRVQAHELARQRRHIGGVLALVVLGALTLFGLIAQFTANAVVKATDASFALDGSYAEVIESYYASQPIERLRFLTNTDHLNEYVQQNAPEVASVRLEGSAGFGKSSFIVKMRRPIAGWSINNKQQYVDETGTPFTRNYYASPSVQITDKSGVQVQAGQAVASNRFLRFVGQTVGLTKQQGYDVTEVVIPSGTTRQIELHLKGIGYPIKLSIDRGVGEQVEDMARAVKWFSARGQSPQFIDIRVGGKAFYR